MTQIQTATTLTAEQFERERVGVAAELARADAKATSLLGALGLPLGVMVVAVPSHDLGPVTATLVALGGLFLGAAALLALQVLRPHLTGGRGTWLHWADCTATQLTGDLTVLDPAERLIELSSLTRVKFRRLRRAIDTTAAGLLVLAAGLASALL